MYRGVAPGEQGTALCLDELGGVLVVAALQHQHLVTPAAADGIVQEHAGCAVQGVEWKLRAPVDTQPALRFYKPTQTSR